MDISPDSILYAVLAFSWVEYLWEAYIGSRYKNDMLFQSITAFMYLKSRIMPSMSVPKIMKIVSPGSGTSIAHAPPCPASWRAS